MGLLDDAIREHLELKRLRGADQGDVARAEREALGAPPHETGAGTGETESAHIHAHEEPQPGSAETFTESASSGRQPTSEGAPRRSGMGDTGSEDTGSETVELDMASLLDSERPSRPPQTVADVSAAPMGSEEEPLGDDDDLLEWEMPGSVEHSAEDEPYAEHRHSDEEAPVEDVLEETPDFLRDTPEQERLWFEQRPPRDFDFNE